MEGLPLAMLIWRGVNQQSSWKGSTKTWEGLPLTMLIWRGVNRHSSWKGSAKTLEGLSNNVDLEGRVDNPPRMNIIRGDPSQVFADPFQVEC